MTVMEFFGCTFIAFGPAFALFIFTIATDALRVIVLMASAFFWLISLLISSLLWIAVVPLHEQLAFGLVFSVLFQELFRLLFYMLLRKADEGLKKVSQNESSGGVTLVNNKFLMAYVAGFGFGLISGAFSMVNVLADSTGPGTVGIHGDSDLFFITSALTTLAYILLHTFWGIIFFAGLDRNNYVYPAIVVASHMFVSCMTLLNGGANPIYLASIIPAYIILVAMGVWAFIVTGGSRQHIKAFILNQNPGYNVN